MSTDRVRSILDFWFEGINDSTAINIKNDPFKKWFVEDAKVDQAIRQQFEGNLLKAAEGKYKDWEGTSQGRLALIILFDQFSRNIYRDTEQMYAYDALALELALRTIDQGKDQELMLIERAFLYLPLMHFEDVTLQQLSVENFTKLVEEARAKNADNIHYYEYSLKHAKEHHDTVAEHGRFPHRDGILNRNI